MQFYRVKKHFQWGQLYLEKDQILEVEDTGDFLQVSLGRVDQIIRVDHKAFESTLQLGRIEPR